MYSIEIENLQKRYGQGTLALDGLNLKVRDGCIFGFVGPNGAGKSTTINILAGILPYDEGQLTVLGKRLDDDNCEYKRHVGFVLERPHFIEKLTASEYLEFSAAMYGIDRVRARRRAAELLDFFELGEKKDDWIESYSNGMKKKVSLAAAILHRPRLLVLDEPLEGIDPLASKRVKSNLRLMSEKGVTVFLSSHNLHTIERFCDEVAIINRGKLVFQDRTDDIRERFREEVSGQTYSSLEEIFAEVVGDEGDASKRTKLSWL